MYEISVKDLRRTLELWEENRNSIMDSQKKYNDEAIAWSKARFEKWISEIEGTENDSKTTD